VEAAKGHAVIEFGLRREPGIDAGMKVARSSYIAGCRGTSNVLAGYAYGIPVFGTMAHSFIMSYHKEIDAFRAFAKTFPEKSTLLIDTYDDLAGAEKAAVVLKELVARGIHAGGVRIDSGDLVESSKKVRQILDRHQLPYAKIFISGDLDEYKITELLNADAPIDSFGVGTKMGTSADRPYLDGIYKLCETQLPNGEFAPIMKLSKDKFTLPGRKQVYRFTNGDGAYKKDTIALVDEPAVGEPLLIKVMSGGELTYKLPSLEEIRGYAAENLVKLPQKHKVLVNAPAYPVEFSVKLQRLIETVKQQITLNEINHSV
jgi:nicotinate phosphoribosyltransferase